MAVVAFIDHGPVADSPLLYAAWAAKHLDQQLVLVAFDAEADTDASFAYEAYGVMDAREDLYRDLLPTEPTRENEPDNAVIEMVQAAARRARELGVEQVRTITSREPLVFFIEHSTSSADLLVFGRQTGQGEPAHRAMDEILHVRRRVLFLAPETYIEPASWLMARDGGPSSGRAVEYLVRNPLIRTLPGTAATVGSDHQQRMHFRDAVRHLRSAGYQVTAHELQGGAEDVLAAILQVTPVHLLVMGAYGQGKFRSLFERSTTSRLLASFKGPVLVTRA